jgi:hypothetical protein
MLAVVLYELPERLVKFLGILVIPQLDHILHRPIITLDLALSHGMRRRTPKVFNCLSKGVASAVLVQNLLYCIDTMDCLDKAPLLARLDGR